MKEIERKFLINKLKWLPVKDKIRIRQGYLSTNRDRIVRVRIAGDLAWLSLKSDDTGFIRNEFEYLIPVADAHEIMKMSIYPPVDKYRYFTEFKGFKWEVDEFLGVNEGLWIAEIELKDVHQTLELPEWIAEEVTHDSRYYNAFLAENPYSAWS